VWRHGRPGRRGSIRGTSWPVDSVFIPSKIRTIRLEPEPIKSPVRIYIFITSSRVRRFHQAYDAAQQINTLIRIRITVQCARALRVKSHCSRIPCTHMTATSGGGGGIPNPSRGRLLQYCVWVKRFPDEITTYTFTYWICRKKISSSCNRSRARAYCILCLNMYNAYTMYLRRCHCVFKRFHTYLPRPTK